VNGAATVTLLTDCATFRATASSLIVRTKSRIPRFLSPPTLTLLPSGNSLRRDQGGYHGPIRQAILVPSASWPVDFRVVPFRQITFLATATAEPRSNARMTQAAYLNRPRERIKPSSS
jgi:hypothetical protein